MITVLLYIRLVNVSFAKVICNRFYNIHSHGYETPKRMRKTQLLSVYFKCLNANDTVRVENMNWCITLLRWRWGRKSIKKFLYTYGISCRHRSKNLRIQPISSTFTDLKWLNHSTLIVYPFLMLYDHFTMFVCCQSDLFLSRNFLIFMWCISVDDLDIHICVCVLYTNIFHFETGHCGRTV